MERKINLKKLSFLVYGLGSSGRSVIKYFKKKKINNFFTWDDNKSLRQQFKSKNASNLRSVFQKVDYIVLSPGISLKKAKYRNNLIKFKRKIITDIDLLYLRNENIKTIVVTGSNGKSTTCKIISHLLKRNGFSVALGGNIGTPVLSLKTGKKNYLVIEASSFQLSHSKFIRPKYAILLNITNDHVDWHGSMQAYKESKLKLFKLQKKNDFALANYKFKNIFKRKKYLSKLVLSKPKDYQKIKYEIQNSYLRSNINDENMNYAYSLSRLLKIKKRSFIKSMNSFIGLSHRYEIFFKKKNTIFINDSKATSFQATKIALANSKNVHWILGGLPKKNDKIDLRYVKNNIIKSYIIGKNINFFKKQLKNKVKFSVEKNLRNAVAKAVEDIKLSKKKCSTILLSPSAASFDQFKNFEIRGNEFKKLSKLYARKIN